MVLLEDVNQDDKLNTALTQIEELQKELTLEREQRAVKEASLTEEISQLQETKVAQENKSKLLTVFHVWSVVNKNRKKNPWAMIREITTDIAYTAQQHRDT